MKTYNLLMLLAGLSTMALMLMGCEAFLLGGAQEPLPLDPPPSGFDTLAHNMGEAFSRDPLGSAIFAVLGAFGLKYGEKVAGKIRRDKALKEAGKAATGG